MCNLCRLIINNIEKRKFSHSRFILGTYDIDSQSSEVSISSKESPSLGMSVAIPFKNKIFFLILKYDSHYRSNFRGEPIMMAALFILILLILYLTWLGKRQWAIATFLMTVILSLVVFWLHMTDSLHVNL